MISVILFPPHSLEACVFNLLKKKKKICRTNLHPCTNFDYLAREKLATFWLLSIFIEAENLQITLNAETKMT